MAISESKFNGGAIEETITDSQIFINFDLGRVKVLEPNTDDVEVFLPNAQLTPWIVGGIVYEIINTGSKTLFLNKWNGDSTGISIGPNKVGSVSLGATTEDGGDVWRCVIRDIQSSTTTPVTTTTTTTTTTSSTTQPPITSSSVGGDGGFTGTWGDPGGGLYGLSNEDPRIDPDYTHLPIFKTETTPFGELARPLPPRKVPAATSVSIVITAINEGPDLEMTIRSLMPLLRENDEIIVVDDGSVLRLDHRVLGFRGVCNIKYVRHETRLGCAQARATGARGSTGDLLIFVDSHMIFPANWLDEMLNAHALHPNAVLCPVSSDIDDENPVTKENGHWGTNADLYTHPEKGVTAIWAPLDIRGASEAIRTPCIMGACYAVSRKVLHALGGWAMGLRGWGFDEEFIAVRAWLLGYEVRLVPSTHAGHRYNRKPMPRADSRSESEEPWVLVYARAYMNFVLFGESVFLGTGEEVERAYQESSVNKHEWVRDRQYIIENRVMSSPGFWRLMNEVRAESNIQLREAYLANG